MAIKIKNIKISYFRGVTSADFQLARVNYFISQNGLGKTSCLAAIARFFPIIRQEERVFLDADFRITEDYSGTPIEIEYDFLFQEEDGV